MKLASGRLAVEAAASFRSGVMAARRPLEASGLGSSPRGGAMRREDAA